MDRRRSKCVDKSMQSNWSPAASRSAYFARQIPRLLWYVGHAYVMSLLAERARKQNGNRKRPQHRTSAPVPDRQRLYRDMAALFRTDLANVEAGLYPLPRDRDGSLLTLLDRSGLFFQDLPRVHHRRQAGEHTEVLNEQTRGRRPNYYLQNFHFQTGGWMTEDSAKRYDLQVEVLFYGTANAIRRQVLPPLREAFAGRDQRWLRRGPSAKGTARVCALLQRGQESSRAPEGCAGAPRHSTGGHDQLTSNAGRTSPSVCPNLSFWYRQVAKVEEILASVGLTSKMSFFPRRLSGGEQQRVAIARAVVAEPSAILADEPTAALDSVNGRAIMTILSATAKQRRRAVLVVTHDPRLFEFVDRIVHIQDGSLTCEPLLDRQADHHAAAAIMQA